MPIDRIEISDYELLGRRIMDWSQDETLRPKDIDEAKTQLRNIMLFPARLKSIEFVQGTLDHLLLQLPPPELAKAAVARARMLDRENSGDHEGPLFYRDRINLDVPRISNLEFLYARLGDTCLTQGE